MVGGLSCAPCNSSSWNGWSCRPVDLQNLSVFRGVRGFQHGKVSLTADMIAPGPSSITWVRHALRPAVSRLDTHNDRDAGNGQ